MTPPQEYEELKAEQFSREIKKLKDEIEKNPEGALSYYYLAKEYMLKVPIRAIDSLKEIEDLLKKSLELAPELWAPKIFLGELLFKQGKFSEAEEYFRKVAEEKPESVSVKEYLAKCIENKKEEYSEKDLLYMFENDLRKFIKNILENEFKSNWWREGIPPKVRADCMARREMGLDEEKDLEPILFANFYDYRGILEGNKSEFSKHMNVKKWCSKLSELEPIRNSIAHNRDLDGAYKKVKECYDELRKVLERKVL